MKVSPLKAIELLVVSVAGVVTGVGPEPLSIVSRTSATPDEVTRFVTATLRKYVRLLIRTWPGVPPEHSRRMSPKRSARPSEWISGGTALGVQNRVVDWDRAIPLKKPNKNSTDRTVCRIENSWGIA